MTYFNTTSEIGARLAEYRAKAECQDARVLEFFIRRELGVVTPSEVWRDEFKQQCPLTSVRRSISNLTKAGLLVKTSMKAVGVYGRPEHGWKLSTKAWYCAMRIRPEKELF